MCVIELELSGFPETPEAVSVTGVLVNVAVDAALSSNVCGEPIPTVAAPGATPTPVGSPLTTIVTLPVDPSTGATWNLICALPPCVILAVAVWPLASDKVKSGGPLSPHPASVTSSAHTAVNHENRRTRPNPSRLCPLGCTMLIIMLHSATLLVPLAFS